MNQDKPIYCIKSRNGRIEKQGDFAEIVAWLRENRINSDDDLRRLGFAVLEKDELWARVKDFPEFNITPREGRQNLTKAARRTNLWGVLGGAFFLVGIALLAWDQAWPRYVESVKVADSQKMAEDAKADAAQRIKIALAESEKAKEAAAAKTKDAVALKESADKLAAQCRQEVVDMKNKLATAIADRGTALRDKKAAEDAKASALEAVREQIKAETESLRNALDVERAKAAKLSADLTDVRETMPLLCKFVPRTAVLGRDWYDFEYINTSRSVINLRFKVTRADGSVLEKSFKVEPAVWTKLKIDDYEFHENDNIAIVPASLDFGKFKPVAYICPPETKK